MLSKLSIYGFSYEKTFVQYLKISRTDIKEKEDQTVGVVCSAVFDFYLSITDQFLKEGGIANSRNIILGRYMLKL